MSLQLLVVSQTLWGWVLHCFHNHGIFLFSRSNDKFFYLLEVLNLLSDIKFTILICISVLVLVVIVYWCVDFLDVTVHL